MAGQDAGKLHLFNLFINLVPGSDIRSASGRHTKLQIHAVHNPVAGEHVDTFRCVNEYGLASGSMTGRQHDTDSGYDLTISLYRFKYL